MCPMAFELETREPATGGRRGLCGLVLAQGRGRDETGVVTCGVKRQIFSLGGENQTAKDW